MRKHSTQPISTDAPEGGILNVVLHGLIGVVITDQCLEALVPQMDDHVFLAGAWGMERRLKQSTTYLLEGVDSNPGYGVDAAMQAPVLHNFPVIDRNPARLFCTIYLPFPFEVRGCRLMSATFTGASAEQIPHGRFAMIHVYRYRFSDVSKLTLGDQLMWMPAFEQDEGGQKAVNLHLFAEPPTHGVAQHSGNRLGHVEEAYRNLVRLFPGMDLQPATAGCPDAAVVTGIGLPAPQQQSLVQRIGNDGPPKPCDDPDNENANCIPFGFVDTDSAAARPAPAASASSRQPIRV
jgi:hypothetical protein